MKKLLIILPFFFLLLQITTYAQKDKDNYSPSSVLASGEWFKIAIMTDGIYRIDYSKLVQIGLGNPGSPRIFGNNFGQLSYYNSDPGPDDLMEIPVFINAGTDGVFNEGDYLLFYGQGTARWDYNPSSQEYDYRPHNYSDTAFYFLTSAPGNGKRVISSPQVSQEPGYTSEESDALYVYEQNPDNLIKSGREWFQPISAERGISFNPGFTDIVTSEEIKCRIRIAARASVATIFRLYEGESLKKSVQVQGVNLFDYTGTYARINDSTGTISPDSHSPVYDIRFYNNDEAGAKGWIDYIKLQGRRSNLFTGTATRFSDSRTVAPGAVTGFTIHTLVNDAVIWDISNPFNVKQVQYTKSGDDLYFKAATDSLKTYMAFTISGTLVPLIKTTRTPNQDLHSSEPADMIIITHPLFKKYAEKLADIHFNNSGLISQVVTPGQIYNEFSGGIPDIVAIRNYLRMKYVKQSGSNHPLKYCLLFGDGSYENRTLPPNNPNFIPTYQSQNSNVFVSSFTSDDFYGLLDDGEGESEGLVDLGIGRLPVADTTQAGIILAKIRRYMDPANMGDWRNVICICPMPKGLLQ
jgi:hypothetical protein